MVEDVVGPIHDFSWGRFNILGTVHSQDGDGVGKDIFVLGTTVTPWYERKGHRLDFPMVERALKAAPDILIIGNGYRKALVVKGQVIREIQRTIGEVIVLPTPDACRLYNQLHHLGKNVLLLAHGTC